MFLLVPVLPPLLNWFTYDPTACAGYKPADIEQYVAQNLKRPDKFGRDGQICAVERPDTWSNTEPYRLAVCDKNHRTAIYAEVYPDCALEWRFPLGSKQM